MNQVLETYKKIAEFAENPLGEQRVLDAVPVGYHVRQGDLYVTAISSYPQNKFTPTTDRQLAPGTSKGSRHTVDETVTVLAPVTPGEVVVVRAKGGRALKKVKVIGPVLISTDRFTVSHPEHADFSLPAGTYQVSYQVDPRTMQRVKD